MKNDSKVGQGCSLLHIDFDEVRQSPISGIPNFNHYQVALIKLFKRLNRSFWQNLESDLFAVKDLVPAQFTLVMQDRR